MVILRTTKRVSTRHGCSPLPAKDMMIIFLAEIESMSHECVDYNDFSVIGVMASCMVVF